MIGYLSISYRILKRTLPAGNRVWGDNKGKLWKKIETQSEDSETSVVQDCHGNFEVDFKPDVKPLVETITEDYKGRVGASVSNSDLDELVQGQKSKNTDRNTRWAVNTFEAWRKSKSDTGELISALDQLDINTHLSR